MLKNRLKSLKHEMSEGKSIEIINENDLSQIKGGKQTTCPKLESCGNHCGDCPNLTCCDINGGC